MRRLTYSAGEQEIVGPQAGAFDPRNNGFSCLLGDFELNGSLRLLLHHDRPRSDRITVRYIAYAYPNEIASSELTVDSKIEQREVAYLVGKLKANADGPNFF
jgi:hypothetical protein